MPLRTTSIPHLNWKLPLEARVKRKLLDEIQAICPKDVTIMHVRQGEAKGLGHAILCAYPVIGNEPFAVVLPDVILDEYTADQHTENLAAMLVRYQLKLKKTKTGKNRHKSVRIL